MPDRSRVAASTTAARSSGRTGESAPPNLPMGVRTASTIHASVTSLLSLPVDAPGVQLGDEAQLLVGGWRRLDDLGCRRERPCDAGPERLERLAGVQRLQAHLGARGAEVEDRPIRDDEGRAPAGHAHPAAGIAAVDVAG